MYNMYLQCRWIVDKYVKLLNKIYATIRLI